jgi:hypothetical protein
MPKRDLESGHASYAQSIFPPQRSCRNLDRDILLQPSASSVSCIGSLVIPPLWESETYVEVMSMKIVSYLPISRMVVGKKVVSEIQVS